MDTSINLDLRKTLSDNGIIILTSESCKYSMRILCDINQTGENWLSEFLGGAVQFNQPAWNGDDVSQHSVMLTRSMLDELGLFIALHQYALIVSYDCKAHGFHSMIRGYASQELFDRELQEHTWLNDCIVRVYHGSANSRNMHQFSGRIE